MDRYGSVESYAETKSTLYTGAAGRVYNLDDPRVMAMRRGEGEERFFTLQEPVENVFGISRRNDEDWLSYGDVLLLPVSEVKMPGRHNWANVLAALAMGDLLGLSMPAMLEAVRSFTGLPHRTEYVAERNDVRWYNDSKGTNVGACVAALNGFACGPIAGKTVLIAGGDGKGADFTPMIEAVSRSVRAVILLGRDGLLIGQILGDAAPKFHVESMQQAVTQADELAQPGDRVLLSPACASFDMYRDYQQRGEFFMDAVRRLVR